MARTRIATVGYLNALPLTACVDRERFDVVASHPRDIARQLADGDVDIALVPVGAVLQDGDYRVVPGLCIGADGPVVSVLIVAETPPEAWTEVLLDGESRTSVLLARLLLQHGPLAERVRSGLVINEVLPGQAPRLARGTTAALVIGDAARALDDRFVERVDLADTWKRWTGLPFVFAVWAGRAGVPSHVRAELVAAGREGIAAVPASRTEADRKYLTENIRYILDDRALMGLRRFAALAHRAGLVPTADISLYAPDATPKRLSDADKARLADAALGHPVPADAWRTWLTETPLAELQTAAHLRRATLHGRSATYAAPGDADDAERWSLHETSGGADAVTTPDADDTAFLAQLQRVVDAGSGVRSLTVRVGLPEGSLVERGRPTPATVLRRIAVARLATQVPHISVCLATAGAEIGQLALESGADDLGLIGDHPTLPPGTATFEVDLSTAERLLRTAGMTPFRRNAAFEHLGGPLTQHRTVRRVEERAPG